MSLRWHCAGYYDGPINVLKGPLKLSQIKNSSQSQAWERERSDASQKREHMHGWELAAELPGWQYKYVEMISPTLNA